MCQQTELTTLFSLGDQCLTGVFPRSKDQVISHGPVDLVRCSHPRGCGLVQLRQSYSLDEMYGDNYGYRSGLNISMVNHLKNKVKKILDMNLLREGDLVIDIGSNDATTLRNYPQGMYTLAGVDPTGGKFREYYNDDICLIPEFFSSDAIKNVFPHRPAKVITSFSMFYDLEDPIAFAQQIEEILDPNGVWIFEQSYLPMMLSTNSFDTICHEHLEFYALKQLMWITQSANLKIVDLEINDVNGGSISIVAAKKSSRLQRNEVLIQETLRSESELGVSDGSAFLLFNDRVKIAKEEMLGFLYRAKAAGKTVAGLGASTKGNVLLQYYNITTDLVAKIGEVNSDKIGYYTPGSLIPMVWEDDLLAENPDYILVLPWHFREFFINLDSLKGRTLVFPLPSLEILHL